MHHAACICAFSADAHASVCTRVPRLLALCAHTYHTSLSLPSLSGPSLSLLSLPALTPCAQMLMWTRMCHREARIREALKHVLTLVWDSPVSPAATGYSASEVVTGLETGACTRSMHGWRSVTVLLCSLGCCAHAACSSLIGWRSVQALLLQSVRASRQCAAVHAAKHPTHATCASALG